MLDVLVRPDGPVAPTSDTPSRVRLRRGGSAANVAVALATSSSDFDVVLSGCGGDDAAADLVDAELRRHGVKPHLERVAGATGIVVAVISDDGQRAMLTDRGVNAQLSLAHVLEHCDDQLRHLHISGYTVLDAQSRAIVSELLATATSLGATTSVDVCSLEPLRQIGAAEFSRAIAGVQTLFANEEEARELAQSDDVNEALARLSGHFEEVVVTRGKRGALVHVTGQIYEVESTARVVVDTTGAGDAATGTYLAYRLRGVDPVTALRQAMEASAVVVSYLGATR